MYSGTSGSEAVNSKYLDLAEKDIESILKSSRDELLGYFDSVSAVNFSRFHKSLSANRINHDSIMNWTDEILSFIRLADYTFFRLENGQYNNPLTYAVFIGLMKSGDQKLSDYIQDMLIRNGRSDYIKAFSKPIKEAVKSHRDEQWKLISLCELDSAEKADLLLRNSSNGLLKARFGDSTVINRILDNFNREKHSKKKRGMLSQLVYVNNQQTITRLIEMLDDTTADTIGRGGNTWGGEPHPVYSFRYYVIKSLARIYPDEPLFGVKFKEIEDGGVEVQKKYLTELHAWVKSKYNIDLQNLRKAEFVCTNINAVFLGPNITGMKVYTIEDLKQEQLEIEKMEKELETLKKAIEEIK